MNFFNLFKPKKKTFSTDFGVFTLISREYNTWAKDNDEDQINYFVNGDSEKPYSEQVNFLKNIGQKVEELDADIQREFVEFYKTPLF